jgi:type I restriction enzyme S subunit
MKNNSVLANKLVGEIPNDWSYINLKEIYSKPIRDFGSFSTTKLITFIDSGIPFIKSEMIKVGAIDWTSVHYVSDEVHKLLNKSFIEKNTILFSKIGSALGKAVVYEGERGVCNSNAAIAKITLNKKVADNYYYTYLLNNSLAKKQFVRLIVSLLPRINLGDISDLILPSPPLAEQRKIANILGTWDKAISTTERLIDNSKQQKKALMQQLLTGKKRLLDDSGKPFEGDWEEVRLDDIAKYQKGYTYKSNEYSESATSNGFLTLKSIQRGGGYSASGIKYLLNSVDEKFTVKTGDVVFAVTDLTRNAEVVGAPIFIPKLPFEKTYISMDLVKLKLNSSVNKQFIYYLLKIPCNRNFMRARASGSTVLHLDVQGSKKLQLFIPKLIEEQKKIATVLTNADKEIELLEQQLTDFKQEKKALMQQLLTGKRRVLV